MSIKAIKYAVGLIISVGMVLVFCSIIEFLALAGTKGRVGDFHQVVIYASSSVLLLIIGLFLRKIKNITTNLGKYVLASIIIFIIGWVASTIYYLFMYNLA